MYLHFLLMVAASAARPPLEVLDDLDRWERGTDQLLDGPGGCWDFSGDVKQIATLHQPPDFFSAARNKRFTFTGTFTGRLQDGVWVRMAHEVAVDDPKEDLDLDLPLYPLMGAAPKSEGEESGGGEFSLSLGGDDTQISANVGQSMNILREAVDTWAGSTETSVAQYDDDADAVVYLREIPVTEDDQRPIKVDVRFPGGGTQSDRIDAVWPRVVKVGQWPIKVTIRDAQMHLLGYPHGEEVLPRLESVSFVVGALGFTLGFEQNLKFTSAAPCPDEAQKTP